jgi:hypothetical protein
MADHAEKINKRFISSYGYSPDYISSMADNFEDMEQIIDHYMDFAGSLEQAYRLKINRISFRKNRIKIMLAKASFLTDGLMNSLLVEDALKKKAKTDGKEAQKLISDLEKEIAGLLEDTSLFICELEQKMC